MTSWSSRFTHIEGSTFFLLNRLDYISSSSCLTPTAQLHLLDIQIVGERDDDFGCFSESAEFQQKSSFPIPVQKHTVLLSKSVEIIENCQNGFGFFKNVFLIPVHVDPKHIGFQQ